MSELPLDISTMVQPFHWFPANIQKQFSFAKIPNLYLGRKENREKGNDRERRKERKPKRETERES